MATRERLKSEEELKFELDEFRLDLFQQIRGARKKMYYVLVPQEFIRYTGSLDAAMFLSQLLHWTGRARRKDGFVFKTFADWEAEIGLSEHRVKQAVKLLVSLGVMDMPIKKMAASKNKNASPTYHYRIRLQELWDSFQRYLDQPELFELERIEAVTNARTINFSSSITKDTSKTAVKKKYRKTAALEKKEEPPSFEDEVIFDDEEQIIFEESEEISRPKIFRGETFEDVERETERRLMESRKAKQNHYERISRLRNDDLRWAFRGVPYSEWNSNWESDLCDAEEEELYRL